MRHARLRPHSTAPRERRGGFAVVEILVGIILMTIGLLGVAGMTVAAARRASTLSMQSTRNGLVLEELNRLSSLSFDSIASRVGCTTFSSSILPHTRCVSYTDVNVGSGYKRIQIIITPANSLAKAETVYINRAKGTPKNPLKP